MLETFHTLTHSLSRRMSTDAGRELIAIDALADILEAVEAAAAISSSLSGGSRLKEEDAGFRLELDG